MTERVRAIRGATTVDQDAAQDISDRVQELLREIVVRNNVAHDDVISVVFTATPDLVSVMRGSCAG